MKSGNSKKIAMQEENTGSKFRASEMFEVGFEVGLGRKAGDIGGKARPAPFRIQEYPSGKFPKKSKPGLCH